MNARKLKTSKCYYHSFFRITNPVYFSYEINDIDLAILFIKRIMLDHILGMLLVNIKVMDFLRSLRYFSMDLLNFFIVLWSDHAQNIVVSVGLLIIKFIKVRLEWYRIHFLRICAFKFRLREDYSYADHNSLNMQTLKNRRTFNYVYFLSKVLSGGFDCNEILFLIELNVDRRSGLAN